MFVEFSEVAILLHSLLFQAEHGENRALLRSILVLY